MRIEAHFQSKQNLNTEEKIETITFKDNIVANTTTQMIQLHMLHLQQ